MALAAVTIRGTAMIQALMALVVWILIFMTPITFGGHGQSQSSQMFLIRLTLRGFVTTTTAFVRVATGGVVVAATARKRPNATGINTVVLFGMLGIEAPVQGAIQVISFVIAAIKGRLSKFLLSL